MIHCRICVDHKTKPSFLVPDPAISCGIDCLLADICLENSESSKVPFPEFGVDIVVRKGNHFIFTNGMEISIS